jgi:hypothetical protein
MSPRTGRPTDNPKNHETRIRMSNSDVEMLEFSSRILGIPKSEVIRLGVKKMYQEAIVQNRKK